tara:strand:+ start:15354 stop:15674 length:321 start_codon:yes stop_codon:yes gene_type:complete
MIFFWLIYYSTVFLISFSFLRLIKNTALKYITFSIVLGLFGSIWFIEPGSEKLAPITSILFLESTFIDSNGIYRLLRPLIGSIFLIFTTTLIVVSIKKFFFKKKQY